MTDLAKRAEASFGAMFHTALRKGADTDWSVVLWNYISLLDVIDEPAAIDEQLWHHFCTSCQRYWQEGKRPSEAALQWAADQDNYRLSDDQRVAPTSASIAFKTMLNLVDEETWKEVDSAIDHWMKH